jgi:hypothetical protein
MINVSDVDVVYMQVDYAAKLSCTGAVRLWNRSWWKSIGENG